MKNFVYISSAKVAMFYPQISKNLAEGETVKAGINVGVFKLEVEKKGGPATAELTRMDELVHYLKDTDQIGSITEPKAFFAGELEARSLIDGNLVFFGGTIEENTQKRFIGLCGSLKHLIGGEYRRLEANELSWWEQRHGVGPVQAEIFNQTSNNVNFAWKLGHIRDKNLLAGKSAYNFSEEKRKRLEALRLSAEEQAVIDKYPLLVRLLQPLVSHSSNMFVLFLGPAWVRLLSLLTGSRARQVYEALEHQSYLPSEAGAIAQLDKEEQDTLDAVRAAVRYPDTPKHNYEFVALTLLNGKSFENPVLLGSPIYVARAPWRQRTSET